MSRLIVPLLVMPLLTAIGFTFYFAIAFHQRGIEDGPPPSMYLPFWIAAAVLALLLWRDEETGWLGAVGLLLGYAAVTTLLMLSSGAAIFNTIDSLLGCSLFNCEEFV